LCRGRAGACIRLGHSGECLHALAYTGFRVSGFGHLERPNSQKPTPKGQRPKPKDIVLLEVGNWYLGVGTWELGLGSWELAIWDFSEIPPESENVGALPHERDDVRDVLIQGQSDLFGSLAQVVAAHGAGEGLVLHPLHDRRSFEVQDALRRTHERGRGDEPGHLVAGEERMLEARLTCHTGIVRVREDG